MEFKLSKYLITTLILVIIGSLLHFVYEFSNENTIVGIFGAINESTWEHLKLLFWPFIFFGIYLYFTQKDLNNNFFTATFLSIIVGMLFIVVIFYIYTAIFKTNFLIVDILLFVFAVIIGNFLYLKLLSSDVLSNNTLELISFILLILLLMCFIFFTFNAPKNILFKDPITSSYGIKHKK